MCKISYLFDYTPYFQGGANDQLSRILLSFKRNHKGAFSLMRSMLANYLRYAELHTTSAILCHVPNHEAQQYSPLQSLCAHVADDCNLVDGSFLIRKLYPTASFCRTGIRDAQDLQQSIEVDPVLAGRHVILIDDVATTGTSMAIVSRLIMQAGALSVQCVALAQTVKLSERRAQHA